MKKKLSTRNPYCVAMKKHCKGGKHRSKKDKRKSGKNKEREFLDGNY
jgi:hypothetical protein